MGNDFRCQLNDSVEETIDFLSQKWGTVRPSASIICGSGWGQTSEIFTESQSLDYSEIPGMNPTSVSGHLGKLILANSNDRQFLVFRGRSHFYEGKGWGPVVFPVFLTHALNSKFLLLTNAAGGISDRIAVGDLMVIRDHINLMPSNPLIGSVLHPDIPRFPDQSAVYDQQLQDKLLEIGLKHKLPLHCGTYLSLAGPAFETPAEIQAFGKLGADAVGMSTTPEAMTANALGMRVAAISCISNLAAGITPHPLSHLDVENTAVKALPVMKRVISEFLKTIH